MNLKKIKKSDLNHKNLIFFKILTIMIFPAVPGSVRRNDGE